MNYELNYECSFYVQITIVEIGELKSLCDVWF